MCRTVAAGSASGLASLAESEDRSATGISAGSAYTV